MTKKNSVRPSPPVRSFRTCEQPEQHGYDSEIGVGIRKYTVLVPILDNNYPIIAPCPESQIFQISVPVLVPDSQDFIPGILVLDADPCSEIVKIYDLYHSKTSEVTIKDTMVCRYYCLRNLMKLGCVIKLFTTIEIKCHGIKCLLIISSTS